MSGDLSQDAIEALIAQQAAEAAGEGAAEPLIEAEEVVLESVEVDEEVDRGRSADAPLSPEEIAALIAAEVGEPSPPPSSTALGLAPAPVVESLAFSELPAVQAPIEELADISLLMDVPLQITVELGQATRTIRELLEIGRGSILHLTRHAGEPVDVLVNGQQIAKGEVVVIDENFGIRVTEVVSPAERLRTMAA